MAVTLVYSPLWFHGIDIVLEVFSVLAAILISFMGYRAYKLTCEKKYLYFSTAFGFITLSFIARAVTIATVLLQFSGGENGIGGPSFSFVEDIFSTGRFFYFLLVLLAYLILLVLGMKIKQKRLLLLLSIFMVFFSATAFTSNPLIFYLVSIVLLGFIAGQYITNYRKKRTNATFLTAIAFSLMVFEFLMFIGGIWYRPLVVGAYGFRLVAYVVLLWMIARVYFIKR